MMLKRGHNLIVACQDDFLVIGASFRECEKALSALQSLLCDLGFEINKKKTVNPTKCFCYGDIFYTNWKQDYPEISDLHINYKEATIAALSVLHWGHLFSNQTIVIYTDNTCKAAIINKCSCRNVSVMHLLRSMFWLSAKYNFVVKAKYIPGSTNVVADAISRLQEDGRLLQVESLVNSFTTTSFK